MIVDSLRHRLLKLLLWPLIPILLVGAVFAYLFALHAAMNAYDLGLLNDALDLSKQVKIQEGKLTLHLPLAAQQMLQENNEDKESYAAWDGSGILFSGTGRLEQLEVFRAHEHRLFHDIVLDGAENRAVILRRQLDGRTFYIAVSQTIRGRSQLMGRIFAGILIPEALLALVSIAVIFWGVRRGLSPVEALRDEIANRTSNDLRPIEETLTSAELSPIVHGINVLLGNLATAFASHRRFIADASHQLRTPLASLCGQIEVGLEDTPKDIKKFLRQLLETTQRTTHLSNQLLSLAKLEHTEHAMYEITTVGFQRIFRETMPDFVSLAARSEVELNFDLQPLDIRGSPLMLRELLSNLLDNAVRHTPAGGRVEVHLQRDGENIWLTVENSGPEIPEDELMKLGTPFHRLSSSQSDGCGLGLAIVREIARLHGADVFFHRGIGGGGLQVRIKFSTFGMAQVP